ncbi:MAG: hypothetical protein Q9209_000022 [Squamulea sp. 1 TL-2023]
MLRLAPTRISLTSVDLDWHIRRQGKRRDRAKNGEASTATADATKSSNQFPKYRPSIDSDLIPNRRQRGNLVPIYSNEPVPQEPEESRPFWGGILADAGALGRVNQPALVRSSRAVIPADTFVEDDASGRPPVQDEDENDWSHDGDLGEPQISPRSPESYPLSPQSTSGSWTSASTQIQSRPTPISLPVRSPDEDNAQSQSSDRSDRELNSEPITRYIAPAQIARSMQGQVISPEDSWANQMDVDGSSDAGPSLHHYRSTSSLQDPEPALIGMPFGAQARRAELAASRSTYADRSSYSNFSTPDRTVPAGHSPLHSSHHMRTRSAGLPRSRLYISEIVASSSPEKRQRSIVESDNPTPPDDIGSGPLRVRKRYKRRESPSYVPSEASNDPTHSAYASENPFDGPPQSSPPESIPHDLDDLFAPPGGFQYRYHGSQYLDTSSAYPASMSSHSHSHSYSSYNDLPSYDYSLLPRQPFQPLPIAPVSTPRTPSNSLPPIYNPVDENAQSHRRHHYGPTTPTSRSSSINLHPTHISIYNDSLPNHSQPQTPHGLPRNGLPRMSLPNPFYTAPARQGGRGLRRSPAVWNADVFVTPTRAEGRRNVGVIGDGRPRVRNDEQENVSREVEAERRERREQGNGERGSWTGGSVRGWRISEWEP